MVKINTFPYEYSLVFTIQWQNPFYMHMRNFHNLKNAIFENGKDLMIHVFVLDKLSIDINDYILYSSIDLIDIDCY